MALQFEIYRNGERLHQFTPTAALVVGPESVYIPGEVTFRDGLLTIGKPDDAPIGVGLLWDVGQLGAFHLETTRLQHRAKPYNLNVELARHRLMRIVQKQEDWNLFDFPKAEKFNVLFKEAQGLLAEALGILDEPARAAKLADDALARAVDLSEQLAIFHGDLLINRRCAGNLFVKHIFGCRADSTAANKRHMEMLGKHFDYAVVPMSWKTLQPQEQVFNTAALDEWVEAMTRQRIPIIGGPLIDLSEADVPPWMYIWQHDFDTLRELAYEYVQKVVQRYRKVVAVWNVAAGLHANSMFTLTFEQIIELTRLLVSQIKTAMPNARTLVTIKQPFGEYHTRSRSSVPPMLYAEMIAQAGINFEAFGVEIEMGVPRPGLFARDLFQLSCLLDRFSVLGRPVFLTAVTVPGRPARNDADRQDPSLAGRWHRPWDPELQGDWMEAVYRMALSKPYVESIAWGNLADINPNMPGGGLFDEMLQPKPAFNRLQALRQLFHNHTRK